MAGTSYTRQSTIADGNIITAALFNNEFNQLINAFAYASSGTTGHQHDGSAGQGGNIAKIGDQDFLNKIEVDSTNNRIGLFVQVSSSAVEQVRIQDGAIVPVTDSDVDLGTNSVRFKDAYIDSATVTGTVSAATVTSTGTTNIVTGVVTGDMTFTGADYNIIFDASASELKFNDGADLLIGTNNDLRIYHDGSNTRIREQGTGNLYITADTQTSMGSSNGAASFVVEGANGTTFSAGGTQKMFINSDGVNFPDNTKLNIGNSSDLQIYHDGTNSRITDTGTGNLYLTGASNISLLSNATTYGVFGTSVDLYYNNSKKFETTNTGATITGNASITGAATAQAFNANSSIDTPTLEVTTLKSRDGTAAGSIADSTGVVTLASSVLTTADINGGTVDNVVIGSSTAAAGTFTSLKASGQVTVENSVPSIVWNDTDGNERSSIFHTGGIAYYTSIDSGETFGQHRFRRDTESGAPINIFETLANGDVKFYEDDGTSSILKIDAVNGRVGVGTSSPSVEFEVNGDAKFTTVDINSGTIDGTVIGGSTAAAGNFTTIDSVNKITATRADNGINFHAISTDADENNGPIMDFERISASPADGDNTGIVNFKGRNDAGQPATYAQFFTEIIDASDGSEDGRLEIRTLQNGTLRPGLTLYTNSGQPEVTVNGYSADVDFRVKGVSQGALIFADSSENKVGIKTGTPTADLDVNGTLAAGLTTISGAGAASTDPTLIVDRTGATDGAILSLKAGGTANANFFSTGGNRLILCDNTNKGIKFTPSSLHPRTSTNGALNNTIDLGLSSSKFRNVYADAIVFDTVAGNATSNTLDDYEEGTWNPVYKGATSDPTYDADSHTAGRYTKIGRAVHAVGRIRTHAGTSPSQGSGQLGISLPFTVMDDGTIDKQFGVLSIAEAKGFLSNQFPYSGFASRNTDVAYINKRNEAEQQTLILNADSALDLTGDDKNDIVFSITYFTDA